MTAMRKVGLPPIIGDDARLLILGTLPGDESLRQQQYYAHARNYFWPLMAEVLRFDLPASYAERCAMLRDHGIAVWDVLSSAERDGSLDSDIRNAKPNDFAALFRRAPDLAAIAFNGQKAHELYRKRVAGRAATDLDRFAVHVLPSTSPTYVKPLVDKAEIWRAAFSKAGIGARAPSRPRTR